MAAHDIAALGDTSDAPWAFCGCAKCVARHIETVASRAAPGELAGNLRIIAKICREWPEQRLAALTSGKHLCGKLSPEGIAAVELFAGCVIESTFTPSPDPSSPPPAALTATTVEDTRAINFLADGSPIDVEVYEPANAGAVVRLVSPRARTVWPERAELFTATAQELAEVRAGATARGFIVREYGTD